MYKYIKLSVLVLLMVIENPVMATTVIEKEEIPVKRIAVFCGADDKVDAKYKEAAYQLGQALSQERYSLITGGSKTGLMLEVTNGFFHDVKTEAAYGVLPEIFRGIGVEHPSIPSNNLLWTQTMDHRLQTFREMSDAVIVLPGGLGTLHELLDSLVHKQFGLINKPIILLNIHHFWEGVLTQIQTMAQEKFLSSSHLNLFKITSTIPETLQHLQGQQPTSEGLKGRYWENK